MKNSICNLVSATKLAEFVSAVGRFRLGAKEQTWIRPQYRQSDACSGIWIL
jgi:hypothetical protein